MTIIKIVCENCENDCIMKITSCKRFDDFNFHWICPLCNKVNNNTIKGNVLSHRGKGNIHRK